MATSQIRQHACAAHRNAIQTQDCFANKAPMSVACLQTAQTEMERRRTWQVVPATAKIAPLRLVCSAMTRGIPTPVAALPGRFATTRWRRVPTRTAASAATLTARPCPECTAINRRANAKPSGLVPLSMALLQIRANAHAG